MMRVVTILICVLSATAAAPDRAPVLVELFTSEGCSSCPPADRLLASLDSQVIVLGEHVDYWDHQGWRDPWSSHASTQRQETYARRFAIEGPYTPQMVVDGSVEFNGSDNRRAADEISHARTRQKATIGLTRRGNSVELAIDAIPHSGNVMLAVALPVGESQVMAGENNGRRLRHVAMVKSLRRIGAAKKGAAFRQTVELGAEASGARVIVFVQDGDAGPVYGAAMLEPAS
jgi:hypothetical protein